ncbi:hypothetical protein BJY04DRAFT_114968 [Aspergillus karnatakaensis]|uniref:uncharacterized protein n=1 Tax=Aspergillus karnatakaensis TaxID=1810916 RepID=UPI003CCD95B3
MTTSCLSTRISLRWPPEPAFENTDTIVLSVQKWYVDLRVDRATGTIDWAIAGERLQDEDSSEVVFTHELDSRSAFGVADCGTFSSLPNGDDLEVGVMPRPDLPGEPVRDYEEVWRKLSYREATKGLSSCLSYVLESGTSQLQLAEGEEKEITRTFVGKIWGTCIVLRQKQFVARSTEGKVVIKSGGEVSARRENFDETSCEFRMKYSLGPESEVLPTHSEIEAARADRFCSKGERFVVGGDEYVVRSFEVVYTRCG